MGEKALLLLSLVNLDTQFQSLCRQHKLWSTAGHKSYEVSKAKIQQLFLSSQYPCGSRSRHWSHDNPQGHCSYISCKNDSVVETPEHILLQFPAYNTTRNMRVNLCFQTKQPVILSDVDNRKLSKYITDRKFVGAILEWDSFSLHIKISPSLSVTSFMILTRLFYISFLMWLALFYFGRTWCYAIHRDR